MVENYFVEYLDIGQLKDRYLDILRMEPIYKMSVTSVCDGEQILTRIFFPSGEGGAGGIKPFCVTGDICYPLWLKYI